MALVQWNVTCTLLIVCVHLLCDLKAKNKFYLWVRNHKDKIRLGLYIQVMEKLLHGVVSTTCVDRSSPGF